MGGPLVNKEIQEFQVQKGKEATEDQLDHKEILENLAHPDQKDRLEKMEIQDLQENKEAQDLKVYQEWKEDLVLWARLVHLVLLATQYQLLRPPCLEERQFLGHLAHKDQWDHLVRPEREVLQVEEGLKEEGGHLDPQVLLVVQEDKVFLEEPEIQELQAKTDVQEGHTLRMI